MRSEYRLRWAEELQHANEPLKKPRDLLNRRLSPDDYVDTAIIGGVGLTDIIAGRIDESQISPAILRAFHEQFPQQESFVALVQAHADNARSLQGIVSGVKGKLFEDDYVAYLNDGHLPAGDVASLAANAHQPAWDIVVHDAHGNVDEFLQLKATQSAGYLREALDRYPDVDVVVTHEMFAKLGSDDVISRSLIDGHTTLAQLNDQAISGVDHASDAADHLYGFHAPEVLIGFVALQSIKRYRSGHVTWQQAVTDFSARSGLAVLARLASVGAAVASSEPMIGLSASIVTRLLGGQVLHNLRKRRTVAAHIKCIVDSRAALTRILPRPVSLRS